MEEAHKMNKEPLLEPANPKGGFRTLPFIIANEAFERVASFGLLPNMIKYLMNEYHMSMVAGTNLISIWSAATNFLPVVGAFIADSFAGRYPVIGVGSLISLVGMALFWSTSMIPQARPPPCIDSSISCSSPTAVQVYVLCLSLGLMSIGAGGIRSSSLAFGVDQLSGQDNHKSESALKKYYAWYYASIVLGVIIALSCVTYIQDHLGWKIGFAVPVVLMFVSALSFFLATPFYIKLQNKTSLLTDFLQVIVASFRNRHLTVSPDSTTTEYHNKKGSEMVVPSNKLRFLNKACIISDPQQYMSDDERIADSWSLCTVHQVEELKAVLKVIPLWSTGVMMSVTISQPSFPVLQAGSMDRHVTSGFEIPAGSFSVFAVISVVLWVALYESFILPLASVIMKKPVRLTTKQRMGAGIFVSFLSVAVTAVIENIRRRIAIKQGLIDDPTAIVNMSAMWLIIPNCLIGIAEVFNAIGQIEFYLSEFPRSMSSIASTLQGLGTCAGNLLATAIFNFVDRVSSGEGKQSWVSSNINRGHYDYYYGVLAGLSLLNLLYFLLCSWAYGPYEVDRIEVLDEGVG
ncbi:hypothetical protein DCAR_0935833 [Daucus carota subsp. sativus]|uniref:Uncharacterized protein n=1 Tax=Daucus carota subsp. sativus TaxID=79200 RepID=A0AAF1BFV4_DAUCS|nr:PREDICTED: protein NRT1/ PTR FAMILY 1.2-like [Daucus carota subsp. sativus]WOH16283.1 hypothetical protein DCAR_0935833 [Daucus carota subsp. sativus]